MVFSGAVFGDSPYRLEKSWLSSVCHISGSTMASHTAFQTSATELMTMLKITARLIRGASLRTPGIELNRLNLLNAIMAHTSATVLRTRRPLPFHVLTRRRSVARTARSSRLNTVLIIFIRSLSHGSSLPYVYFTPLLPKPPVPLSVASRESTTATFTFGAATIIN